MICQLIGGSLLVSEALKKVLVFWFLKKDQISDHLGERPIFVKFGAAILKTSKQKDLHFDLNFFAK
jgi:cadmium resistance protein CadD (predicted permease)